MAPSKTALDTWTPRTLALLRIVTAFLFLQHGTAKLLSVPHVAYFDHLQVMSLIGFAGMLEVVGSVLLILGLFTRPTAFILSGEMAVAYWWVHFPRNVYPVLNGGDAAILYCFVFLYMVFAGGGPWSLDRVWRKAD